MRKKLSVPTVALMIVILFSNGFAQNPMRELKRMKGYTIIEVSIVSKVIEDSDGEKYVKLDNGFIFKVEFLLLDPLTYTDVIVFAKPLPTDLRRQYENKLPEVMLYSYKLLIDREVYDATPHVSR